VDDFKMDESMPLLGEVARNRGLIRERIYLQHSQRHGTNRDNPKGLQKFCPERAALLW
jgi:hypothetical protein